MTVAVASGVLLLLPIAVAVALRQNGESVSVPSDEGAGLRVVRTVTPGRSETSTLTLPASIDAFQTTLIHSRVTGYLLRWYVDIGEKVKAGQKLADIDTPELDQELEQARANLAQGQADLETARAELKEVQAGLAEVDAEIVRARANHEYSKSVLRRNELLHEKRVISDQDMDESRRDSDVRQAEVDAAAAQRMTREATAATCAAKILSREATVNSLKANVRRLEKLQGFKTIAAPFAGVVTRRRAEIGILVTAGSAVSSQELFAIAQTDSLRIRINVPQSLAPSIETGREARVLVPEWPDRVFTAKVARTAQAIDPVSRTLTVELELPNADRGVLPGTFAQVVLPVRRAVPVATIPAKTLLNRPEGLRVAVVGPEGVVRLQEIRIGRDYGSTVEVVSGLAGGERLIVNPPDDLAENERVSVADSSQAASPTVGTAAAGAVPKPGT